MNDFKAEPVALREAMVEACRRVLESGWYVLGREVAEFECQWASICGVAHGVGVGNGMDAIEISLRSLNIGPGDEVITTPMTAFASVLAILRAGATPVMADIEAHSALLSIQSVRRCISPKTRAVLLVHLYGQLRSMDAWQSLCLENDLHLIEDCAQAHLAAWRGTVAGSFGVVGTYSFYPTKNLGAPGDAGMLVTSSNALAQHAGRLRNYGQHSRYHHPELGMNSRLDEIQAAMLSVRIGWILEFTKRRQEIAARYRSEIGSVHVKQMAVPEEEASHVYHLYVITCSAREELQAHLLRQRVQSLIHYPVPIQQQTPCLNIKRDPLGLLNSEQHAAECLSLPCHPQMTNEEVTKVIEAVNSFEPH